MPQPSLLQVGASNELPESEELDALYDRFLIRRQVSQVSQAGLLEMLANGGGRRQAIALRSPGAATASTDADDSTTTSSSKGEAAGAAGRAAAAALVPLLSADDFEGTRGRALDEVEVPASVLQLIADLRTYLQVRGC
jgi:MoxR-like ATPase